MSNAILAGQGPALGVAWGVDAYSPAVDLHGLIAVVAPEVRPGAGRTRFLNHVDRLIQDFASEAPSRLPECWWLIRQQVVAPGQMSKDERALWTSLNESLVARWNPWECGWGWQALALAIHQRSVPGVQALLAIPGTPGNLALSETLLPNASSSNRAPSGPASVSGTALGMALRQGDHFRQELVSVLLGCGVDPNVAVDREGRVALSLATSAAVVKALVSKGARLATPELVTGWMAGLANLRPGMEALSLQSRFSAWREAVAVPEGGSFRQDLLAHWPSLVETAGATLSQLPSRASENNESMAAAKALRALGRTLGSDCWRPGAKGVSLAGAWARASLLDQPAVGLPEPSRVTSKLSARVFANGREGTWEGRSPDGLHAAAWGLLVETVHCKPGSLEGLNLSLFRSASLPWAWEELGSAVDQIPVSPLLWRVLRQLEKLPDPAVAPLVKRWQNQCLAKALGQAEQGLAVWSLGTAWEELSVLMSARATAWISACPEDRTAAPTPVQTLLELFVLDGWRRPAAQRLLQECLSSDEPLDRERLREKMDHHLAVRNAPIAQKPQWEALGLELSLEHAPAIRRPRM